MIFTAYKIKAHGSKLQGQEEAAYVRIFNLSMRPLQ